MLCATSIDVSARRVPPQLIALFNCAFCPSSSVPPAIVILFALTTPPSLIRSVPAGCTVTFPLIVQLEPAPRTSTVPRAEGDEPVIVLFALETVPPFVICSVPERELPENPTVRPPLLNHDE